MNAIMKLSHRSSSFSQGDIYNRLLDMHEELQKSSRSLNNLINQSLRQLQNPKEDNRFSFSAEFQQQNQQQQKEEEESIKLEEVDEKKQISEREQILENKIQIYESALITLEEEKQEKDEEIIRLKNMLDHQDNMQNVKNVEVNKKQSVIREHLQRLDDHLNYLEEKKLMIEKIKEYEVKFKEQKETIDSQKLEISRLKHINQYLHKSIDKLQKL
ncbi:unnamed protein product (macronuclear) [Paramecium tetraurelia]|uniref:Uncharacterized protein n=1 Tax=Paramecium tetraurelia TaxID=5888 RepID=A0C1R0_PARTE|nr:uncharacterized protein GSPATT00034204001 [Paramecium tetraurelia]CAK64727.1 unnamed protein product [Paramecium tetraurelia]|eukprot:XP_001432124.1 hypothetical protein (macronuclear) [Paramecium tetraurelia strain d4-2]